MTATKEVADYFARVFGQLDDEKIVRKVGNFLIKMIKVRTRSEGKGVARPGGPTRKLKRVGDKYAKWRANRPAHPEAATGINSNLTLKGTLLDSMVLRKATRKQILIGFKNTKEEKVAEGQAAQGRTFLVLSAGEITEARKYLISILKKL